MLLSDLHLDQLLVTPLSSRFTIERVNRQSHLHNLPYYRHDAHRLEVVQDITVVHISVSRNFK